MPLCHQILSQAAGRNLKPGDEAWAPVDLAIMHDSSGPRRLAPVLEELGGKVWDPDRVVLATDHFIPAANARRANLLQLTRRWAREKGVHFYDEAGILHNILLEEGYVAPGMLIAGADASACMAGVHAAMTFAIGSTEMATVLATGEIWFTVPEAILIRCDGPLTPGLMARDVTISILGQLKGDFAIDYVVEFTGDCFEQWPLDEKAVLTNQAVEMGAISGLMNPDASLLKALAERGIHPVRPLEPITSSEGYAREYRFHTSQMEPMIARTPSVDNAYPVSKLAGEPVDRAYIGSCVGGKLEDLHAAARILRGRKVAIPLTVVPATRGIYAQALRDGTLETLLEAGARIQTPGCGACAGLQSGALAAGERCIATTTRNYPGRMGDPTAEIFLASPMTVAASALTGRITDPREVLERSVA